MKRSLSLFAVLCFAMVWASAQSTPSAAPAKPDYSGMYSFLQDGEFLQLTVEDAGRLTGFISRFGDLESDRGAFLDQFFKEGKIDGTRLSFTTETVHGTWFEFKGSVARGPGKAPGEEAYYVVKGTLTEHNTDTNKKTTSKSREVEFKAFPQDQVPAPEKRQ
ncbi:MAG TPA: hypothetical protein VFA68_18850 [Terriglobales bacterium]|nr:hypothetical protein [Terriglobales bacterium]